MRIDIDVEGLEEASRRIRSIVSTLESRDVENVLFQGAKIIRAEARSRAQRGPTGNLRRSIKASRGKRRGKLFATAFSAIDRKKAPHAHLIELGTGPRYHKKTRKYVGRVIGKPFFQPAVQATKNEVATVVNEGIARLIGRAAR